ncbi:glutathione S-transferase family protein [Ancylobacter radicis]|uniref:glutathione transferase n=1 Tax=Ancylobacter radicis TaxID=2836179 RepID=A0ABS5R324_9HYPH|nr:glutathione S-transferase family protein [Ancylobacter radicis]MBS9476058.1 glutathione S-transferase family protein [Ancylobacter radicis]
MTGTPRLFGATYSVYVRIARLALAEKGVAHELVPVDPFAPGGPSPDYLRRQPFGRIPAFEHEDFRLYETGAITRYVDEAFAGPPLQPAGPRERARCNQIIGLADAYAYRALVWGVYVEQVEKPARGESTNDAALATAVAQASTCLAALTDLMGEGPWLAGPHLSLADLHLAPMVAYFRLAPQGAAMMDRFPALAAWWSRMAARPSMALTRFDAEPVPAS